MNYSDVPPEDALKAHRMSLSRQETKVCQLQAQLGEAKRQRDYLESLIAHCESKLAKPDQS